MTTRVYTRRLMGPRAILPSAQIDTLYTVPAGYHVVLKQLTVVNNSTTLACIVRVGIGPANLGANRIYRAALGASENLFLPMTVAVSAGESVTAFEDNAAPVAISITGYLFLADG